MEEKVTISKTQRASKQQFNELLVEVLLIHSGFSEEYYHMLLTSIVAFTSIIVKDVMLLMINGQKLWEYQG